MTYLDVGKKFVYRVFQCKWLSLFDLIAAFISMCNQMVTNQISEILIIFQASRMKLFPNYVLISY